MVDAFKTARCRPAPGVPVEIDMQMDRQRFERGIDLALRVLDRTLQLLGVVVRPRRAAPAETQKQRARARKRDRQDDIGDQIRHPSHGQVQIGRHDPAKPAIALAIFRLQRCPGGIELFRESLAELAGKPPAAEIGATGPDPDPGPHEQARPRPRHELLEIEDEEIVLGIRGIVDQIDRDIDRTAKRRQAQPGQRAAQRVGDQPVGPARHAPPRSSTSRNRSHISAISGCQPPLRSKNRR
ncbi:MAG: hypothetical protein JKP98_04495 [Rhodobacteraceae bacterium]|nr:hypothetical protein [Paracoccaceae bacterium]